MILIGFSTSRSWISAVIRWFTRSKVSHAFISYYDPVYQEPMVLEADSTGFRIITLARFNTSNQVVEMVPPKIDVSGSMAFIGQWLGTPYDWKSLFGEGLVMLLRRLGRRIRNPFTSSSKLICSESVVRLLQHAKYPGAETLIPDSTSPEDLLDFLKETV